MDLLILIEELDVAIEDRGRGGDSEVGGAQEVDAVATNRGNSCSGTRVGNRGVEGDELFDPDAFDSSSELRAEDISLVHEGDIAFSIVRVTLGVRIGSVGSSIEVATILGVRSDRVDSSVSLLVHDNSQVPRAGIPSVQKDLAADIETFGNNSIAGASVRGDSLINSIEQDVHRGVEGHSSPRNECNEIFGLNSIHDGANQASNTRLGSLASAIGHHRTRTIDATGASI